MKIKINKYGRAATIKIKINSNCVNNCSFCRFNKSNELLRVKDISYFLDLIKGIKYYRIIINGGEPTIHPDYLSIINFLTPLKEKIKLELGTNLIPFTYKKFIQKKYLERSLDVFSRFQIGCDDEHKNIDIVEKFVPILVNKNKEVAINAIKGFYSKRTQERLEKLKKDCSITLYFSNLSHDYGQLKPINKIGALCKYREMEFLLNSNGDGFFCYQQEFETPLFNLFSESETEIINVLQNKKIDSPFKFCAYCSKYEPDIM